MSIDSFTGVLGITGAVFVAVALLVLAAFTILMPLYVARISGRMSRVTEQLNSIGKLLQQLVDAQKPREAPIRLPGAKPAPDLVETIRVAQFGKDLGDMPLETVRQHLEAGRMTLADHYLSSSGAWKPLAECRYLQD